MRITTRGKGRKEPAEFQTHLRERNIDALAHRRPCASAEEEERVHRQVADACNAPRRAAAAAGADGREPRADFAEPQRQPVALLDQIARHPHRVPEQTTPGASARVTHKLT
jgi:hypothetical protein